MKKLINDQTIDFDVHRAGDGQAVSIDGLHMHKRMNGKKFRGVDVLFPLDEKDEVIYRPANTSEIVKRQLINEIKQAIKRDRSKRTELVESIIGEIQRYTQGLPNIEQERAIRLGAERIAKIFAKNPSVEEQMKQAIDSQIEMFITKHKKDENGYFFIKQDFVRKRVRIGDNLEAINKANEPREFIL